MFKVFGFGLEVCRLGLFTTQQRVSGDHMFVTLSLVEHHFCSTSFCAMACQHD
jgi:hypothetical protein